MKTTVNRSWHEVEFNVGDRVYLKLKLYRQRSVARHRNEKLALRYFGRFVVLERIGKVAYRLKLPDNARIHPVFHVSQLKNALGNRAVAPMLPATLTDEMEVLLYPELVEGVREVLIRWKDLLDYEATLEPWEALDHQFPEFHLADKVHVWEGSNDTP